MSTVVARYFMHTFFSDIQHRVMASQNGRLIQEWLGERFP
jgi:hypothetical protein